jgi:hypothetical protein
LFHLFMSSLLGYYIYQLRKHTYVKLTLFMALCIAAPGSTLVGFGWIHSSGPEVLWIFVASIPPTPSVFTLI